MLPTVLFVEMDPDVRSMIERGLAPGFSVVGVRTGRKALEVIEQARPDIVLLEQILPDMTGLDLLTRLKRNTATRGIPVLMLTSDRDGDHVIRAGLLGAFAYMTKPPSLEKLRQKLQRAWEILQQERRIRGTHGAASSVSLSRRPGLSVFQLDGVMDAHMVKSFSEYATPEFMTLAKLDEIALDLSGLVEMSEQGRNFLRMILAIVEGEKRRPRLIAGRHYQALLEMNVDPETQIFLMIDDLVNYLRMHVPMHHHHWP